MGRQSKGFAAKIGQGWSRLFGDPRAETHERVIRPPYPHYNWEASIAAAERDPHMSNEDFALVMGYNTVPGDDVNTSPIVQRYRDAAEQESRRRHLAAAQQGSLPGQQTGPLTIPSDPNDILGDLFTNLPPSPAAIVPSHHVFPQTPNGPEQIIHRHPEQMKTTSNMTREELKARRIARVENAANVVEPFHLQVMLRFLDGLCLIGPFWILVWTTSEVGQLFTGKAFNITDQTSWNVYAAALFGECVLAGLTFMWQYADAYTRSLDDNSPQQVTMKKWVRGLGLTWALFACISALGQFVYLKGVWSAQDVWSYILISGRVVIYTAGEWACAKYLGWRVTTLKKIAQEEKAKGEMYEMIADQEANRTAKEAEAEARLQQIQRQSKTMERNADMTGKVQEIMSDSAVKFLDRFTDTVDTVMNNVLENVNDRLQLPPPVVEQKPIKLEEIGEDDE